jgi:hypothetical protein
MKGRHHTPEQIIRELAEGEKLLAPQCPMRPSIHGNAKRPIDAGRAEDVESFVADELTQAHKTIAELEAELEVVKAASALFNGEDPISPGGARLSKGWATCAIPSEMPAG